jgi:hypothetical protein
VCAKKKRRFEDVTVELKGRRDLLSLRSRLILKTC